MKNQITPKLGSGSFGCTITVKEGMEIEADTLGENRKAITQFLQKKISHISFSCEMKVMKVKLKMFSSNVKSVIICLKIMISETNIL